MEAVKNRLTRFGRDTGSLVVDADANFVAYSSGGKLNEAASKYRETEAESSGTLKTFGDVVESYGGAIGRIAGGLAGGAGGAAGRSIGGVLGGAASGTAQE